VRCWSRKIVLLHINIFIYSVDWTESCQVGLGLIGLNSDELCWIGWVELCWIQLGEARLRSWFEFIPIEFCYRYVRLSWSELSVLVWHEQKVHDFWYVGVNRVYVFDRQLYSELKCIRFNWFADLCVIFHDFILC